MGSSLIEVLSHAGFLPCGLQTSGLTLLIPLGSPHNNFSLYTSQSNIFRNIPVITDNISLGKQHQHIQYSRLCISLYKSLPARSSLIRSNLKLTNKVEINNHKVHNSLGQINSLQQPGVVTVLMRLKTLYCCKNKGWGLYRMM